MHYFKIHLVLVALLVSRHRLCHAVYFVSRFARVEARRVRGAASGGRLAALVPHPPLPVHRSLLSAPHPPLAALRCRSVSSGKAPS